MDATKLRVAELMHYPIKSCAGERMESGRVGVYGLESDRKYMVVDADSGMFVAQRSGEGLGIAIPIMCQITPQTINDGEVLVSAPRMGNFRFDSNTWDQQNQRDIQVWKYRGRGVLAPDYVNEWFTAFLSKERAARYELVMAPEGFDRPTKLGDVRFRFGDAYSFLVLTLETLGDINHRVGGERISMNRFRPNVVLSGGDPYMEDRIDEMIIGGCLAFEGKTLCERCGVPNIDQFLAGTAESKEPNRTLGTYRRGRHLNTPLAGNPNAIYVGRNFIHHSIGLIAVGDEVHVQKWSS